MQDTPTQQMRQSDHPDKPQFSDRERFDWLRLIRSENVGPATFHDLCSHFGSAAKALEALPALSRRGGAKRPVRIATEREVQEEWEQIHLAGARLVALGEAGYPHDLSHIHAPPPLLTIMGDTDLAARPSLAIVGSRNCSASGQKLTRQLSSDLGAHGLVITSGLARGVDTAAHEAALNSGTIAVIAGGLNRIYPEQNKALAATIARRGLLVSEMPWNWQARSRDFPRRNRIISGISTGTLVVEAAKRSGSLITARYALEQGREVFAIPGSPLDPRASGTNHLIKQGAYLVCDTDDILEPLANRMLFSSRTAPQLQEQRSFPSPPIPSSSMPDGHYQPSSSTGMEADHDSRNHFIQSLGPTPISIDELIRLTGLTPPEAQMILLELDLAGRLERHGNQTVSLKP